MLTKVQAAARHTFYTLLGVLLFGWAIVMHEAGHLVPGVLLGLNISEFSVGFGPLITQVHALGLDWSLRAIPLGGYCMFEDVELQSLSMFIALSGGVAVNFVTAYICTQIANWRGEAEVSIGELPEWMKNLPWYFGGLLVRLLGFPFHVMYRLGVEIEEGDYFRAFGMFHLILGSCNLIPLIPFVDGAKMFSIILAAIFGGNILLWMAAAPIIFYAGLRSFLWWVKVDAGKRARQIGRAQQAIKDITWQFTWREELNTYVVLCEFDDEAPEGSDWEIRVTNPRKKASILIHGSYNTLGTPESHWKQIMDRLHLINDEEKPWDGKDLTSAE